MMADPQDEGGVRRPPVDWGHDLFDHAAVDHAHIPLPLIGLDAQVQSRGLAEAIRAVMREHADLTVDGWRWKSWRDANPEAYAKDPRDMLTESFGRGVLDILVYLAITPIEGATCSWDLNRDACESVGRRMRVRAAALMPFSSMSRSRGGR